MPSSHSSLMDDQTGEEDDVESGGLSHAFFTHAKIITLVISREILLFCPRTFKCLCRCSLPFVPDLFGVIPDSCLGLICLDANRFKLWNLRINRGISPTVTLDQEILAISANRKRIIISTRTKVLIFVLKSLDLIFAMDRGEMTTEVSMGLLAASKEGKIAFVLADGSVQVMNSFTLYRSEPTKAHTSPITALHLSSEILVTGSMKGTIIRVFSYLFKYCFWPMAKKR